MTVAELKEYVKETRWWSQARCAGMDPRFDAENASDFDRGLLRVCRDCPVRVLCAIDAILHGESLTVRGGFRLRGRQRGGAKLRAWLKSAHNIELPEFQHVTNPNLAKGNAKGVCTRWHDAGCGCWKESA